jgi:plastocyanin
MKARWALVLIAVMMLGAVGTLRYATTSTAVASPGSSVTRAPKADADLAAQVYISALAYRPKELRVPLGTEVTWVNRDHAKHTVTGDDFDSGDIGYHGTYSHTFYEPGRFSYHDRHYHWMTAVIDVGE